MIAFDCCTDRVSVTGRRDTWIAPEGRGGNRHLLAGIQAVETSYPNDLSDLYFTAGPGSFTGIRIGIATALGLHYGGGVRLHPVNTLLALAWASDQEGVVNVSLPAHGGMRYCATYEVKGDETSILAPPRLMPDLTEKPTPLPVMPLSKALFLHRAQIPETLPPIPPLYIADSDARPPG